MGDFYISPSRGRLTLAELFADIVSYVEEDPEANYRLIIGTDSQTREELTFVTAIVIHRQGKGARYFYRRTQQRKIESLRQRIYLEAAMSLTVASQLTDLLAAQGHPELNIEIHLDLGHEGDTKHLIREIVGMVIGSGFDARIKPESYGASSVADRYTK
ncbi:MAG: ribonuclease H-like YkuK family protein [Bacillota bacterium]